MERNHTHHEEERLFGEALLLSSAQRDRFLVRTCGEDATLMRRVGELLREHDRTANALDGSPGRDLIAATVVDPTTAPQSGSLASNAGCYSLGEKLGEGGWGTVYAAEQWQPVRRSVAIKIIKLGMDTRAIVMRFQTERQALALMEHENIARVFDAGATADGRPFFAMERVHGTRITRYCDEQRLSIRERLELFMQICDAVQHAHQKGVIHRDLKPSNLLVAGVGRAARPKIIDFGIAKATQGRLNDETVVTEVDGFVGTPAYMSPEQADTRGESIDTRSDIYSLGVILYELLTGRAPLEATNVREVGIEEVRRRIREVEPLRPSTRIGRLGEDARREAAERRGLTAARFGDALAGDLDSVVMKCLEKSPARRYESASALAQDLGRHLHHEPVIARSAGQWYVWGKFVRRNRTAFGIAAAIGLLLIAGVTVSTLLLFRERAALARAVAAEHEQMRAREKAEQASRLARTEVARSARATEFMTSVFDGVEPAVARGRDTALLRELLDVAAARLDSMLQDEPEVEADLRDVIGEAFWHLDEPGRAAQMHRRALALHEQTLGETHPKVAFTLIRLGLFEMYHGDEAAAEKAFRRAGEIRAPALGREDPRTLDARFFLVETLTRQQRFSEAAELLEQVRAVQLRIFPSDDLRLLRTEFKLADLLHRDGFVTHAERLLRGIVTRYPADTKGQVLSFFRAQPLLSLSGLLLEQDRIDEAIETLRQCVASRIAQGYANLGEDLLLAHVLHLRGRCDEALTVVKPSTERARQLVGRDKSRRFIIQLAWAATRQGECLAHTGRLAEAEPFLREACALSFPPITAIGRHPAFALAEVLRQRGAPAKADTALESALRQANRDGNEFTFQLLPPIYRSLRAQTADRAEALMREQLASEAAWIEKKGPVAGAPYSLTLLCAAADVGAFRLISPIVRERLAWWKQHRPAEAPAHEYGVLAGEVLVAEGRMDEAERLLLVASEGLERTKRYWKSEPVWRAGHLRGALTRFYVACTRPEKPGWWRQLMTGGTFDPEWELSLARALFEAGRYREADEILPGVRTRLEERLARKPDHDRLAALVSNAAALGSECSARVRSRAEAEITAEQKK